MRFKENLVFDIGMHKGEDTAHYLKKGYNVLAVEANPVLVDLCRQKFQAEIQDKRLIILNVGIAEKIGVLPFYINHHTSEWSSFDETMGTRTDKYEVIDIPCVRMITLFEQQGIPFYMKVDIEGFDYVCLNDIPNTGPKPNYVSCEATTVGLLDTMHQKGYTKFKLINQANNFRPVNVKQESSLAYVSYRKVKHAFKHQLQKFVLPQYVGGSSGPFGEDTKGEWQTYEQIRQLYLDFYQGNRNVPVNHISWFDFHATL